MTTTKPTILLIPGAWHTPAHYSALLKELEKSSYPTTSHKLPSVDCTDASKHTAQTDADFIRTQLLLPLLDDGKRVVVAMHSYGGLPGSAAAYGLSEEERREEGKQPFTPQTSQPNPNILANSPSTKYSTRRPYQTNPN